MVRCGDEELRFATKGWLAQFSCPSPRSRKQDFSIDEAFKVGERDSLSAGSFLMYNCDFAFTFD